MRSNEARERMVERVQAAKDKWPAFTDLPAVVGYPTVAFDPAVLRLDPAAYIKALYAAAYQGEIVGRTGNAIAIRKVTERRI
jgi:hypothetical protein